MSKVSSPNPDFERARALSAPLGDRLAAYAAAHKERSPAVAAAYQALIDSLLDGRAGQGSPKPGDRLPPFLLPDQDGRLIGLADLLAGGPLVISFNRGSWCSFCALALSALAACSASIAQAGGRVVSIMPETATYSRSLRQRLALDFPVLSDLDNAYALELGLAIATSPEVRRLFSDGGLDLGLYQNNQSWFVPVPATFIVARDGTVDTAYVNPDFRHRLDPAGLAGRIAVLA